jgi:prepilin-type processing-associated H-X9-DG protein
VVVAIIAILAALLMPALSGVRDRARQLSCMNQLKQWGVALTTYTSDNEGKYPDGYNPHGTWVDVDIAPYLGGANLTVTTRDSFWRNWLVCPSKRGTRQENIHYYNNVAKGIQLVEADYMYWGGYGDPPGSGGITGPYAAYGWNTGDFKNGHAPTPTTYGELWPSDPSTRVLMCDLAAYDSGSGSRVAKINGTVPDSGDPAVRITHGWQRMQSSGINLLYVDGHVSWKAHPWQGGTNYWNGGFGPMDW